MHDSEEEILLLSDSIVNTLREEVVNHIGCLYTVSEGVSPAQSDETHSLIALLDLLWGFADYAIGSSRCRPNLTRRKPMRSSRVCGHSCGTFDEVACTHDRSAKVGTLYWTLLATVTSFATTGRFSDMSSLKMSYAEDGLATFQLIGGPK